MDLPKFHETFMPILRVLADNQVISAKELNDYVIQNEYKNLPPELLNQTDKSSGKSTLRGRINWGKAYLKQGKFVHFPARGHVQITAKGQEVISNQKFITIQLLRQDEDFLAGRFANIKNASQQQTNLQTTNKDEQNPQEKIDEGIAQIDAEVKTELLELLRNVDAYKFEAIVLKLLAKMGYGDTETTSKSHDGGIDGIVKEDKLGLDKIYLQAKRYGEDNKVREKDIRNFIGAMSGDTQKGVFFTTSSFDDKAIAKAANAHHKIILIDGHKLVDLMHEYNVGVQTDNKIIIKKVDADFFDG